VLESTRAETGCLYKDLTVLDIKHDPYRQDTPAGHRDGAWIAAQLRNAVGAIGRIHWRGLHYAIVVRGDVIKPNGEPYRNTNEDWLWLIEDAGKAAKWNGYVDFDRLIDQRNDKPEILRRRAAEVPIERRLTTGVDWDEELAFDLGELSVSRPCPSLVGFDRTQPFALTLWGEKSSLIDVLMPVAMRHEADLYVGMGEASDTLIHQMAKDAVADGRPLMFITCTDFDPAGRQMPVSIGRKLQALRSRCFPNLRFKVVPAALTFKQVRDLGLPSTPLKESERRSDRWRAEFGVEQTEIDALATLQPAVLRRIVETALEPYYDARLQSRVTWAKIQWERQANSIIDAHVDEEALNVIEWRVEDIKAEATQRIETLKAEVAARVADATAQLQEMIEDIELPEAPDLSEAELAEEPQGSVLISSDWTWIEQTRALKAQKSYGNGEDSS